ncbi:MAG: hypothetical protein RTV72_14180 [Candidatus Thorarchaeota archaeon]
MSEAVPPKEKPDVTELNQYLFWLTLIFGAVSGAASYFILRFSYDLTWYFLAPILYTLNYVCIFLIVYYRSKGVCPDNLKCLLRFTLKYSGTWIIAYFAVGTAIFYFGW